VTLLVTGAVAFIGTIALTALVRRMVVAEALIDLPNERSSHSTPTPRGGGLAIVLVVLTGVVLLRSAGALPDPMAIAVLGGGAMVAVTGWLDDRRSLGVLVRLTAHLCAAAWALWWLGGMPELIVGREVAYLGLGGTLLAGATIVWATNITNFMDGIDGLAAAEVATVTLGACVLLAPGAPDIAALAALVGGAAAGFLPWNWRPARIFMGDVGSGFLGFVLAVLSVASERAHALPALAWLVLFGVFAFDATTTILRRAWRGERWYTAHRSHAYQRAVQAGYSHARVTAAVVVIDAGLFLLAALGAARPDLLLPAVAAATAACASAYLLVERLRGMSRPNVSGAQ
jgi:glycosyltransferase WbpL